MSISIVEPVVNQPIVKLSLETLSETLTCIICSKKLYSFTEHKCDNNFNKINNPKVAYELLIILPIE